jgi:hypothetical protein
MQGIYTYIPETKNVPKKYYSVATVYGFHITSSCVDSIMYFYYYYCDQKACEPLHSV